jgi:arsenate reductase
MAEAGVDISAQESHAVRDFLTRDIDLAVIVCDAAAKSCPRFAPSVKMIAKPFDDPKDLIAGLEREEDILGVYRRVRDEIRGYIQGLPGLLE